MQNIKIIILISSFNNGNENENLYVSNLVIVKWESFEALIHNTKKYKY